MRNCPARGPQETYSVGVLTQPRRPADMSTTQYTVVTQISVLVAAVRQIR